MPQTTSTSHRHRQTRQRRLKSLIRLAAVSLSVLFCMFCLLVIFFPTQYRLLIPGLRSATDPFFYDPVGTNAFDGIDVSHHQGIIDWPTVAAQPNIHFVYVKATEGSTHIDSLYRRNIVGARQAGLPVGSYHFLTSSSPVHTQFAHFRTQTADFGQDLLPMVDVEWAGVRGWNRTQIQDSLAVFLFLAKKHYGRYPLIYADARFYNDNLSPRFDKLPLFIARYSDEAPTVKGAHRHYIWQRSQHGRIDGIERHVDLNTFAKGTTLNDILLPTTSIP